MNLREPELKEAQRVVLHRSLDAIQKAEAAALAVSLIDGDRDTFIGLAGEAWDTVQRKLVLYRAEAAKVNASL